MSNIIENYFCIFFPEFFMLNFGFLHKIFGISYTQYGFVVFAIIISLLNIFLVYKNFLRAAGAMFLLPVVVSLYVISFHFLCVDISVYFFKFDTRSSIYYQQYIIISSFAILLASSSLFISYFRNYFIIISILVFSLFALNYLFLIFVFFVQRNFYSVGLI